MSTYDYYSGSSVTAAEPVMVADGSSASGGPALSLSSEVMEVPSSVHYIYPGPNPYYGGTIGYSWAGRPPATGSPPPAPRGGRGRMGGPSPFSASAMTGSPTTTASTVTMAAAVSDSHSHHSRIPKKIIADASSTATMAMTRDSDGKEEDLSEDVIRRIPERIKKESSARSLYKRRPVCATPTAEVGVIAGSGAPLIPSHIKLLFGGRKKTAKSRTTKEFLLTALKKEVLFKDIDETTLKNIARAMYAVDCKPGDNIITQGEYGDAWFVVEFGVLLIIRQNATHEAPKAVGEFSEGHSFGESSLLFSIPRTATIQAKKASRVWALDAKQFIELRTAMSKTRAERSGRMVKFLSKIEFFSSRFANDGDLEEIARVLYSKKYRKGDMIVLQGEPSTEFFIIRHGTVDVRIADSVTGVTKVVATLSAMESFGERGLVKGAPRAATIVCTSTHVKCYVMKQEDFNNLLGPTLSDAFMKQIRKQDAVNLEAEARTGFISLVKCKLSDFEAIGVLGVGSFGRVSLVQDPATAETYSLKKVRKNKVIETSQEEHVRNERAVLANLDSDFCCRLYATYQDRLNIYFLLEPVLGGELFTVLRWNQRFSEKTASFYTACTVLAFEHLHSKNLIYRDLKPENLLIAANGYCKLVDFGFAKRRNRSTTLCGTPEYLAPEVIHGYPQNFGVDWWELGIFTYEMVFGEAPFQDDATTQMYTKILMEAPLFPTRTPPVSDVFKDLIRKLLTKEASSRLGSGRGGAKQIKSHAWFARIGWETMLRQEKKPPYVPSIESATDVSQFEDYPDEEIDEDLLPDPDGSLYSWCEDF